MENHSSNIPSAVFTPELKEGMEVRCKESMKAEGYSSEKWYMVYRYDGYLLLSNDSGQIPHDNWTIGTEQWQLEASHKYFDLLNPRYPVNVQEKDNGGWISVEDRLPADCEEVIVWIKERFETAVQAFYNAKHSTWHISTEVTDAARSIDRYDGTIDHDITHWQPLPSPPKI